MEVISNKYCRECGASLNNNQATCPNCGAEQFIEDDFAIKGKVDNNKWLTTLLLCWFVGVFGVHRFYTGHTAIGVVQLLTAGGCGIWVIVDLILIITGQFEDADGNVIKSA